MIELAVRAQEKLAHFSDDRLDTVMTEIINIFASDLTYWASEELKQSQIGNVKDKVHKLALVTDRVYRELFGVKTFGRLNTPTPFVEYAAPIGLIFAVVPLTNPVPNALFKTLMCLKTRNSLILSFPRKAQAIGSLMVQKIQDILVHYDLKDAIQAVKTPSRETTQALMQAPEVGLILATGGSGLVKSAYSSGTPAIGVGPGNVPVLIGCTANLQQAVEHIIQSKTYDNGIVCGSESNIVVDEDVYDEFICVLKQNQVCVLQERDDIDAFVARNFDGNILKREKIGVEASQLTDTACRLVVLEQTKGFEFLTQEKLTPLLTIVKAKHKQGIQVAESLLWQSGTGHTAVIHSHDQYEIQTFAEQLPAGRVLVNLPATHGMLGIDSDIPLSFMQSSGTWGSNGSTAPVTWRDFVNIKRLSYGN